MNRRDRRREEDAKREAQERREEAQKRETESKEEQAKYAKSRLVDMKYTDSIGTLAHCTYRVLRDNNLNDDEVDAAAEYYLGKKHDAEDFYKEQSVSK
jgi:hypothetical protein